MKMTNKQRFETIMSYAEVKADADMTAWIEHQIELLDKKKASTSSKPTKRQIENESIKAEIADILIQADEGMTVTQILAQLKKPELTNQRVSALLSRMEGVKKEYVKNVALFTAE